MTLLWEITTQHISKMVESLSQWVGLTAYRYLVETFDIEPLPRQFKQSQHIKGLMQWLTLGQSTHVVQPCVKLHIASAVTLQTATRLMLTFQHQHATPALCQLSGTNQTSQSTAYDNHIVFHWLVRLSHR